MTAPSWLQEAADFPSEYLLGWLVLMGLLFGSFLNVVIYRLPRGESLLGPRSRCPACGVTVKARDNVPLLGWLLLKGRCRHCSEPISARYPLVEILGAACVVAAAWTSPDAVAAALRSVMLLTLVAVFFIDLDHQLILDVITLPGIVVGLLVAPFLGTTRLDAVIGAAAGAGLLLLLREAWLRFRNMDALGVGDIKLAAFLGAWLGWQGVAMTFLFGSFVGVLVGGVLIAVNRTNSRTTLPFGSFLAPAAMVVVLRGQEIWSWYLGLGV